MKKYDLIVVGGGITGVSAATCAARQGLSVLLIERYGSLGGAMTQALVFPFMKFTANRGKKRLSDGIFTEIQKRHKDYGDLSWETFKFVYDDMVTEAGVDVLFHATVYKVETDGRKIKSVGITCRSQTFTAEADFFIDTTGDGDLFTLAGCDYQLGREPDGYTQPMTTCFRLGNIDTDLYWKEIKTVQQIYNQFQQENKIKNPRENILSMQGLGDGYIHFNTTRIVKLDPTDPADLSQAEIIARRQVHEMVDFLKNNTESCKNATIISIASEIGIRESRKLKGKHILTAEELLRTEKFEDAIALGNYDIDIHNPTGTGTYIHEFPDSDYYSIPYRSLVPNEYDNMLVAGRCISATHEAQAAIRIMPICACMGQAAGTAIAVAKRSNTDVNTVDIKEVQQVLTENGAQVS